MATMTTDHSPAAIRRPARRIPAPLLWTGGVIITIVALVAIFLAWFNWNMLRGPIAAEASAATGRSVRIDGDLSVHLWSLTPSATVRELKISNPRWMRGGGDMADIDSLTVSARLWPLLVGRVDLTRIQAEGPKLSLYRDAGGRANWTMGDPNRPAKLPPIQHFVINDGRIHFVDVKRNLVIDGTMQSNETGGGRGVFHLTGQGSLNREPFNLVVTGGPLIDVRRDRPYRFSADLRAGETHVLAAGDLPKPFDFSLVQAHLDITGQNFADLYDLTGLALPTTPPYRLSGEIARDQHRYTFRNVVGHMGSSDVAGMFVVDHRDGRPDLHATLRSRRLDTADLGTLLGAPPRTGKTATQAADAARLASQGHILPDTRLDVRRVRQMDAVVHYRADSLLARKGLPLTGFSLDLVLDHGVMTAEPFAFTLPHGSVTGHVRIDARKDTPYTDADVRVTNIHAEDFFHAASAAAPLAGLIEARVQLHGPGASVHDAAANANGSFTVVAPHAQIRKALAELLGVDVIKGLGLYLSHDQSQTDVRCAVADFQASHGLLTARTLVLDTNPVLSTGKGTIDLRDETLDLALTGHPKRFQLIRLASPITVSGHLKSPKVGVKAGGAPAQAAVAVVLGALINPLAAVLPFVDPGLAKNADCATLVAQAQHQGAPVRVAQTTR